MLTHTLRSNNNMIDIEEMDMFYSCAAFDEMDCDTSVDDILRSTKYALDDKPEGDVRCVSVESGSSCSPGVWSDSPSVAGPQCDLFEDYDILPTILGTGHFGTVRECLHRATGEKYAVKTIEKSKCERLDHVRREIELLRSVDHPGIMRMVDHYEDDEYVHIVTEMYTGGELFDRIVDSTTDRGCMPERQAAKIIKSLLEAVRYLHDKDIVHRDIKPENVLFESDDEGAAVKLIDFGLSRRHTPTDEDMSNGVGTLYYMHPGVLRGKYDRSCDVWSVGIVAYILLTGYPPFNGDDDREIHESILGGYFGFDERLWGTLSRDARDFVTRLLRTDSFGIASADAALRHPWIARA